MSSTGLQEVARLPIGVDARKFPGGLRNAPSTTLRRAREEGFDGVFFRTVLDLSPSLDPAELHDLRQLADDLDLYLETGLGKVNPYAIPESPELRAAGDGDTLLGFRRMMEASAEIGCRELWAATAGYQLRASGRFVWDRFRTDVSWADQLDATVGFLRRLRPIAADLDVHVNLETHEEITSFELVGIVESVGADVFGIVYDTANLAQRLEHYAWTAARVAPYVRQVQLKDCTVTPHAEGYEFALASSCGEGTIDFGVILRELSAGPVPLNLTIEARECVDDYPGPAPVIVMPIQDPEFVASHRDLTVPEFAAFVGWGASPIGVHEDRDTARFDEPAALQALRRSRDHLRGVLAQLDRDRPAATEGDVDR
ncbi:sugar phosphate isomerase/epimerase family protein [Microbacterium sp. 2MCAF23]|uniref:sugar phosphate isomerase/epimerase family protein n=1 Tax=Microbacterium sp. 2MCAF23 TaxID=3232985 RepID=UPI003F9D0D68